MASRILVCSSNKCMLTCNQKLNRCQTITVLPTFGTGFYTQQFYIILESELFYFKE